MEMRPDCREAELIDKVAATATAGSPGIEQAEEHTATDHAGGRGT